MKMTESKEMGLIFGSYNKKGLIELRNKLKEGKSSIKYLLIDFGIGTIGYAVTPVGGAMLFWGTAYGAYAATPRRRDRIAAKLTKHIKNMNNDDNCFI